MDHEEGSGNTSSCGSLCFRSEAFGQVLGLVLGTPRLLKVPEMEERSKLDTYIVFVQTEPRYLGIPYHRRRVGLNHLAFHARSRGQVDEITRHLKEEKIPILYRDKHPHAGGPDHYALYFEDPDRIKVELVAPVTNTRNRMT